MGKRVGAAQAVLQDDMTVQLSDLGARVITGGVRADNLVRDYDAGLQVLYQRPLRDPLGRLPTTQVPLPLLPATPALVPPSPLIVELWCSLAAIPS